MTAPSIITSLYLPSVSMASQPTKRAALVTSEYDGALEKHTNSMKHLLNETPARTFFILNIQRGLNYIKSRAKRLAGIPIRYLSVLNGAMVFKNERDLPTEQWLEKLSESDVLPRWRQKILESTRWDSKTVEQVLQDKLWDQFALKRTYFNKSTRGPRHAVSMAQKEHPFVLVRGPEGDPSFILASTEPETHKELMQFTETLSRNIKASLMAQGIQTDYILTSSYRAVKSVGFPHMVMGIFHPKGAHKLSPVKYAVRHENPELILSAGSLESDLPLLRLGTYQGKPNFRFICGQHLLPRTEQYKTNVTRVPSQPDWMGNMMSSLLDKIGLRYANAQDNTKQKGP
jgi:hypothetical protein